MVNSEVKDEALLNAANKRLEELQALTASIDWALMLYFLDLSRNRWKIAAVLFENEIIYNNLQLGHIGYCNFPYIFFD